VIYGLAIDCGQLSYFYAIESIPIGLAVLLEYLGVVLVVGWLWVVRGQLPGRLTVAGVVAAMAGLAFVADLAGTSQLSPIGIMWGLLEAVCLAASKDHFRFIRGEYFGLRASACSCLVSSAQIDQRGWNMRCASGAVNAIMSADSPDPALSLAVLARSA
jgi:drug/metabolite transporter (DMT)-like permease